MTPEDCIAARLNALAGRLSEARTLVDAATVDETLRRRMHTRLASELDKHRERVAQIQDQVQRSPGTRAAWVLLSGIESQSAPALQECMAYLAGARARAANIDGGLCEIADALLDEIEDRCGLGWHRFTILAEDESFSDVVQLIRLRFPPAGIWDLPIAAHEYGHFAAHRITVPGTGARRSLAISELIETRAATGRPPKVLRDHLNELFADCFATFVLGPSYAFSSLLLRFNQGMALEDGERHPSTAKRFAAITGMLAGMNQEADSLGCFEASLDVLKRFWAAALDETECSHAADIVKEAKIALLVHNFYTSLKEGLPDARYRSWGNAIMHGPAIKGTAEIAADFSRIDLLNAAWIERLTPRSAPAAISKRAASLCLPSRQGHAP